MYLFLYFLATYNFQIIFNNLSDLQRFFIQAVDMQFPEKVSFL
jgi:hypothetical protein